jgi:hypothetical protein
MLKAAREISRQLSGDLMRLDGILRQIRHAIAVDK